MLIIDRPMPEGCDVCPLMYDYIQCRALPEGCEDDDAFHEWDFDYTKRPEWCPLKELETDAELCDRCGRRRLKSNREGR